MQPGKEFLQSKMQRFVWTGVIQEFSFKIIHLFSQSALELDMDVFADIAYVVIEDMGDERAK